MPVRMKLVALVSLVLLVGSGAISACGNSGAVRIPDGPHMIYFYAQW